MNNKAQLPLFSAMAQWILFAISAMLLFSFSSLALKVASEKHDFLDAAKQLWLPIILGVAVFAIAAFYLSSTSAISLPSSYSMWAAGAIAAALIGFVLFLLSIQQGKVAAVTAVLSFGTIVTAIASNYFLGVEFTLKEIAAMVLAVIAISLFVL